MNYNKWIKKNCFSLTGKTICITGSTGGLAKEFVETFAKLGANFIFANRDKEKTEKQKQEILKKYPETKITFIKVDMFDMNSVKLFICKLKQQHIDILILNAAVYNVQRKKSLDGYDNIFQINFISPYYIVKQMLPILSKTKNSKVIAIGSIAHNFCKVNFDDIQMLKTSKQKLIYGNSKRFFMFSLYNLFSSSRVELSIVHPGITLTNMTNHYPKLINWLVKIGIKLFFPSAKKASLSIVYGAFNLTQNNEWIGPKCHNIWGYPKLKKLNTCSNEESKKIFETAEKIYNKISK